nr:MULTISPECIES: hypothetical protein [unclassified Microcystis]
MRKILRERSRNPNREVWESPSVLRRRGCQQRLGKETILCRVRRAPKSVLAKHIA